MNDKEKENWLEEYHKLNPILKNEEKVLNDKYEYYDREQKQKEKFEESKMLNSDMVEDFNIFSSDVLLSWKFTMEKWEEEGVLKDEAKDEFKKSLATMLGMLEENIMQFLKEGK